MMKILARTTTLLGLSVGLGLCIGAAAAGEGPEGIWRLDSGKLTVEVTYCGGEDLCAKIVGLEKPLNKQGQPKVDKENPDPALRSRPVIGLQVVNEMKPAGSNKWKGYIYNADDGGTYRSTMEISGDAMVLKGCWGPLCKKNKFVRVN